MIKSYTYTAYMKKLAWKIYYWLVLFVSIFAIITLVTDGGKHSFAYGVDTFLALSWTIALYSYLYKKFPKYLSYWYLLFWVNVIYSLCYVTYNFMPHTAIGKILSVLSDTSSVDSFADA